ncbi:glycine cleavage system protein GcvH [Candidatus Methylacidithermus pantelleriae]|uniref:Glycine cleavage system H protein n=1 Tax=Candidatus Methylacidithermus pantelleriae TaxID=2744239 RepID=A0A8J2BST6_9BACT|nr:glycine cleavage system protein GcvH [Candidatus Methylacidithermus pantelleriae]CAF0696047.1 glycine cleavage system H protein [Candidatus Methylacidithermus pantelleriae]
MNIPNDRFYTSTHEWVLVNESVATVGITDHAQSQLSDIVYVELPAPGKRVEKGTVVAVVESVKAAADVYAPVTGTVMEVNDALREEPSFINQDPYGQGWIVRLQIEKPSELSSLLSPEAYRLLSNGAS